MRHVPAPPSGAVLGVDVGYAAKAATTGLCVLEWDEVCVRWSFRRTRSCMEQRRNELRDLVDGRRLCGVALDGPLTRGLWRVAHYRTADALLSHGCLQKRGKPGQTSSPTGQQLHAHATMLAELVLRECEIDPARHYQAIHERCLVEAFPSLFLGAGVPEGEIPVLRRDASDRYWEVLVEESGRLLELLRALLPDREPQDDLRSCRDHEHRAAFVCALTALSVVARQHVGVGDPCDGDIVLPPHAWWGTSSGSAEPWMERVLRESLARVRDHGRNHHHHRNARLVLHDGEWRMDGAQDRASLRTAS